MWTDPFLTGEPETFDEVMDSVPPARLPSDVAAETTAELNARTES
jgi:hypothetical protein